jgi:hypothetical protein
VNIQNAVERVGGRRAERDMKTFTAAASYRFEPSHRRLQKTLMRRFGDCERVVRSEIGDPLGSKSYETSRSIAVAQRRSPKRESLTVGQT